MEKLPICRICLVANVRIHVEVHKTLHEVYEKLTDIPFVTEDRRPMLACFFCCAKLKQCYRLLRQCLEAEKLFAQMMNGDYEPNTLINQGHLEIFSGFIQSPTENISIIDVVQTESSTVKEELPAVFEYVVDTIEPKEENLSEELELENFDNSCLDVADIAPHHTVSDLEDDVPLMEFKIQVEKQEVSKNKQRARETKRATVAKKPKLDTRRTKLEDAITAERTKKEISDSKVIPMIRKRTSKPGICFKKPYKCDQRSFHTVKNIIQHIRTHTGEKPYKCDACQRSFSGKSTLLRHIRIHTGEKPYKCDACQHSFTQKNYLTNHIRKHTGERPFKCDICRCTFRTSRHLTTHIRKHTVEKLFKCDVCQRSFRDKGTLTNHNRIHSGEKPFECDICLCSFRQKGHLTKHIRIHH